MQCHTPKLQSMPTGTVFTTVLHVLIFCCRQVLLINTTKVYLRLKILGAIANVTYAQFLHSQSM